MCFYMRQRRCAVIILENAVVVNRLIPWCRTDACFCGPIPIFLLPQCAVCTHWGCFTFEMKYIFVYIYLIRYTCGSPRAQDKFCVAAAAAAARMLPEFYLDLLYLFHMLKRLRQTTLPHRRAMHVCLIELFPCRNQQSTSSATLCTSSWPSSRATGSLIPFARAPTHSRFQLGAVRGGEAARRRGKTPLLGTCCRATARSDSCRTNASDPP